jgi:hypothetical protein
MQDMYYTVAPVLESATNIGADRWSEDTIYVKQIVGFLNENGAYAEKIQFYFVDCNLQIDRFADTLLQG